jgi:hypothetical protein
LRIKGSCFYASPKKLAGGTFGLMGLFRQITAHFFAQKDAQINRFGHIEHFRKKLPMILAKNNGQFHRESGL